MKTGKTPITPARAITQLNDPLFFGLHIDTTQLALALQQDHHHKLSPKIAQEVHSLSSKSIFVGLKWLIFLHESLQISDSQAHAAFLESLVGQVQLPMSENKHQQYVRDKLGVPYLQYLIKLSQLLRVELSESSSGDPQLPFREFNLLVMVSTHFDKPILEFSNFLKKHYPYLQQYSDLLAEDAKLMLAHLKQERSLELLKGVSVFQVEQISSKLRKVLGVDREQPGNTTKDTNESCSPILFKNVSEMMDELD